MTLALPPEDMASASYSESTNLYTVTDSSGQRFEMTEESFNEFIVSMGMTVSDLGVFRSKLIGGSTVETRFYAESYPQAGAYTAEVDLVNLKLGGFEDAIALQEAYKTVFYPTRTEQLDRVYHGLETGLVISEDIKTSYIENDGEVTADVVSVQSEFENRGGGLSERDVEEAREENAHGSEEAPAGEQPAATEEQPEML
jgi:hypothetical protein